ncbi:MAG: barstar family protein [Mogibacterium sp.]|nr:barstar family protein [Mogibacterium sp.]
MEKILIIREADFEDKEEALDRIAAELGFPEYFGRNLDALYDCLCDLEGPVNLAFESGDPADADTADWYTEIRCTVWDAACENEDIRVFDRVWPEEY